MADETLRKLEMNLCILRMLEDIFLLGAAQIIITLEKLMSSAVFIISA